MSKGGAGKVYFVLYLAVILELLIIFIERDEAEEGLRKQQQEAIQIVQTILSQLQTGSGTQGINAQPKDNITLSEKDQKANTRNYDVYVAVGDPKASSVVQGQTIRGDDVSKLTYTVSHIGNDKLLEEDLGTDSLNIENGNQIFQAELGTLVGGYATPKQTYGASIPADMSEGKSYFTLNEDLTNAQLARGRRVKVFSVNFKPNLGAGWYRLLFTSETNKILGVTGEPKADDTVRIGNIKLTVKQLRNVQKVLRKERKGGAVSQVEGYIEKLLKPDAYKDLPENKGYTSFNVHVVKPEAQRPSDPVAQIIAPDTITWYNVAPLKLQVRLGPEEGSKDVSGAVLTKNPSIPGLFDATVTDLQVTGDGLRPIIATARNGGKTETSEKFLRIQKPEIVGKGIKATPDGKVEGWKGLKAVYGNPYDPSTDWASKAIPGDHYQTVVTFDDKEVLNLPGTNFKNVSQEQKEALKVKEGTRKIKTTVFWKPNGTVRTEEWKELLSTEPDAPAAFTGNSVTIRYPDPTQDDGFECNWVIKTAADMKNICGGIQLSQSIGSRKIPVVAANATAPTEAAEFGITASLKPGADDFTWQLELVGDPNKIRSRIRELAGKSFEFGIDMTGQNNTAATGSVTVTVRVGG